MLFFHVTGMGAQPFYCANYALVPHLARADLEIAPEGSRCRLPSPQVKYFFACRHLLVFEIVAPTAAVNVNWNISFHQCGQPSVAVSIPLANKAYFRAAA